jgi:hypothetical protein
MARFLLHTVLTAFAAPRVAWATDAPNVIEGGACGHARIELGRRIYRRGYDDYTAVDRVRAAKARSTDANGLSVQAFRCCSRNARWMASSGVALIAHVLAADTSLRPAEHDPGNQAYLPGIMKTADSGPRAIW